MKFKIGDKVKVVRSRCNAPIYSEYIGKIFTVKEIEDVSVNGGYIFQEDERFMWYDDELEFVKEKFDFHKYEGNYVMHCSTEEQATIFCAFMHIHGFSWFMGRPYSDNTNYSHYGCNTCYNWKTGCYSEVCYYEYKGFTILEFDNFDWSDFTMKKEFTKKDLKNGDVIKRRNGAIEIVCVDTSTLICRSGWNPLNDLRDDLTYGRDSWRDADIVAVRRPICASDCQFDAFVERRGRLVYERKEPEEMTLEEVCKALGKEIKIVKSK